MHNSKFTILYVDDERENLNAFRNSFRRDYHVLTADNAARGLELLEEHPVDLVLSDQRMPEMTGVEFLKRVISKHPEPNRILVTAYSDFDAIENAVNEASIFKYVKKPWDPGNFKKIIDRALEIYDLRRKNKELTQQLLDKNKELEKANLELQDSDRLKFDFLKIISHEIRTPLNGLKGATQLFKVSLADGIDLDTKPLFKILENSAARLEQFLLLAERITNLKARQYPLETQRVSAASLIKTAAAEINEEFEVRRQTIAYDFENLEPIEADSKILSICIREVLHNASRHSPEGATIYAKAQTEDDQTTIEIVDHGEGFPDAVLKNLFKVFVREDSDRDRRLGLNLALTKLVMDLHGGQAEAFNNEHGGATIRLTLARQPQPAHVH